MQTNAPISAPGDNGRLTGLVYTRDETLAQDIKRAVQPICRIKAVSASVQEVLQSIEQYDAGICFVHIRNDQVEDGMALVGQLRRVHPGLGVFIVADRKDPDLILQGLRLGVLDVIIPTANGKDCFLPALQHALGRKATEGRNGFVYALFSLKGGQGVTTLSVNLADQIQLLTGGRVLLLDLNLYLGDVGAVANISPDFTPFDLIRDLARMDENLLISSLYRHARGFYILPSPAVISDAERIHRDQISAMIKLLKRHFTHIVIDLPHDFSERTLAAAEASDRLMVLVEPDLVSVKSAQQVLNFFQELNYGDDRLAFLLNRLTKSSVLQPEDVEMVLKQPLLATVANDWTALSRSVRKGEPLGVAHGRRRITRNLHELAARIMGMTPTARRRGWLGRFN
ncbi:transcriptional regulator [Desulfosarcina ovata subsp. sediminis]|uniref:Transcriptional regulator n=1 Tax=Desulfosarcina ovata subsp. sediminis TaxID=885957 RepID=A0A5K8A236_9BACT|nr:cellulose synthase operon protein YhjQ/BcsQ [Desulfosarcina ovata]BBO86506.1 transcriptional regulator [Desulfosarcina ovata subsp. sediminis]